MATNKFTYLVIENAPDVCEGIIRRMGKFGNWQSQGFCLSIKEAISKIGTLQPNLLFLDWGLNGGSAYEVLQAVQNIQGYNPYIIFNTGFQKDNPEIPQEIINNYKVDKYLVKPLWEQLRQNLPTYLAEAEQKANASTVKPKILWIESVEGLRLPVQLDNLICICQHPTESRFRIFYFANESKNIIVQLQWHKCFELLNRHSIDFFVTKNREHLVCKPFIVSFEKPFIRMKNFPAKIEVVKESIRQFEDWLTKQQ